MVKKNNNISYFDITNFVSKKQSMAILNCVTLVEARCQFHQHFTWAFFIQKSFWQLFQFHVGRKSCAKHFRTKNVHRKRWWNRLQKKYFQKSTKFIRVACEGKKNLFVLEGYFKSGFQTNKQSTLMTESMHIFSITRFWTAWFVMKRSWVRMPPPLKRRFKLMLNQLWFTTRKKSKSNEQDPILDIHIFIGESNIEVN